MKLITTGNAGTMESNDIMITVEPSDAGGVQVDLTSSVYQQCSPQMTEVEPGHIVACHLAGGSMK